MKNLRYYLSVCLLICSTAVSAQLTNPSSESTVNKTTQSSDTWRGLKVSYKPITLDYNGGDDALTGFSAEYVLSFKLSDTTPLFLESGLGYQYVTYEESAEAEGVKIKAELALHSLYVPFNLGYKHYFDEKFAIMPFIGLNLRGNISGEMTLSEDYYGEEYDLDLFDDNDMEDEAWNRFQIGWQIGIGLNISKFYAGISYGSDFNELYEDAKLKTTSITLGINF